MRRPRRERVWEIYSVWPAEYDLAAAGASPQPSYCCRNAKSVASFLRYLGGLMPSVIEHHGSAWWMIPLRR